MWICKKKYRARESKIWCVYFLVGCKCCWREKIARQNAEDVIIYIARWVFASTAGKSVGSSSGSGKKMEILRSDRGLILIDWTSLLQDHCCYVVLSSCWKSAPPVDDIENQRNNFADSRCQIRLFEGANSKPRLLMCIYSDFKI